jgi:hypothetical protein
MVENLSKIKFLSEQGMDTEEVNKMKGLLDDTDRKSYERCVNDGAIQAEEYMGQRFEALKKILDQEVTEYYEELGFNKEELVNAPVLVSDKQVRGEEAMATGPYIRMSKIDIDDSEMHDLVFMDILAHETYHNSAPRRFSVSHGVINLTSLGLCFEQDGKYRGRKKRGPFAIEEVYAERFRKRFKKRLETIFSENTLDRYRDICEQIKRRENHREGALVMINRFKKNGEISYTINDEYICGEKLVNFLEKQIPNLHRLIEGVRIRQNTLKSAKICRDIFGKKEVFRKIVTTPATEKDVDSLLDYLKERLLRKQ